MATAEPSRHAAGAEAQSAKAARAAGIIVMACAALAACGGSTAIQSIAGPDPVRCQTTPRAEPSSVGVDGGSITIAVDAARECDWTASSDAGWLQLGVSSGTGTASITATAAASQQGTPRTATVQINNSRLSIAQAARPCAYALASRGMQFGREGGRGSVAVTTLDGCTWRATTGVSWISLPGTTGTGSGSIEFEVSSNPGEARDGAITIGELTFAVGQAAFSSPDPLPPAPTPSPDPTPAPAPGPTPTPAPPAPNCTATVTPSKIDAPAAGMVATLSVSIGTTCTWTASGNRSWFAITSATSGRGSLNVVVSVSANTGVARTGTVTVASRQIPVAQAAAPAAPPTPPLCTYSLTPESRSVVANAGEGRVTVTTQSGCAWSATSNAPWVTLTTAAGTGSGDAVYLVAENTSATQRSGTVTIQSETHTVVQAAAAAPPPSPPPAPCTYTVDPAAQSIAAAGGPGQFAVTTQAACAWTAATTATWIGITSGTGTGNGAVTFNVQANTVTSPRSATITVNGQSHTVNQAAAAAPPPPACTYTVDPAAQSIAVAGGPGQFAVMTQAACAWTAATTATWIGITSGTGTGNGTVAFNAQANTVTSPRSATITVNGQSHTVNQAAAAPPCTYTVDPASLAFAAAGGPGQFTVNTAPGCPWSSATTLTWVTVTGGGGSGTGTVTYTVQANTATAPRNGTITAGGQTHTVTQAAAAPPPPPPCTYSLEPALRDVSASAGEQRFTVNTQAGCTWSAITVTAWLTITGGTSGTGSGEVIYQVQANPDPAARSGAVSVAGQVHTVNQAASSSGPGGGPGGGGGGG